MKPFSCILDQCIRIKEGLGWTHVVMRSRDVPRPKSAIILKHCRLLWILLSLCDFTLHNHLPWMNEALWKALQVPFMFKSVSRLYTILQFLRPQKVCVCVLTMSHTYFLVIHYELSFLFFFYFIFIVLHVLRSSETKRWASNNISNHQIQPTCWAHTDESVQPEPKEKEKENNKNKETI